MYGMSIAELVQQIRDGGYDVREEVISLLRKSVDLPGACKQIVGADGCEVLLGIVQTGEGHDRSQTLELLKLLADDQEPMTAIVSAGGIGILATVLRCGTDSEVTLATQVLPKLTWSFSLTPLSVSAADVAELVQLVQTDDAEKQVIGMKTLSTIAYGQVNQELIVAAECIPLSVALLSTPSSIRIHAAALLAHLAIGVESKLKQCIASAGAIPLLVDITHAGTALERVEAARALQGLASCLENHEVIVAAGGIEALLAVTKGGSDAQQVPAMKALVELSRVHTSNREKLVAAGAIPVLLELVHTRAGFYERDALQLLRVLASDDSSKAAILAHGGVEPLVVLVRDGAEWLRVLAMEVLSDLAVLEASLQMMISAELHPLLLQLATRGSSDEQRVAMPLLQVLMDFAIAQQKQHN